MQIKVSPGHRKCKYPPCNNILSIYNHEAHCNIHLKAAFWKDKVGGIPAKQGEGDISKDKAVKRSLGQTAANLTRR